MASGAFSGAQFAGEVKVLSQDADATPPTITVDGGKWAPMYDASQVWSDTIQPSTLDPDTPLSRGFDGDLSTDVRSDDLSNPLILTFPGGLTVNDKVEIYGAREYKSKVCTVIVNEGLGDETTTTPNTDLVWATIYSGSSIKTISIKYDATYKGSFTGLRLDGKILVDEVNESQVWSNGATVAHPRSDYPITAAFNGDPSTYVISDKGENNSIEVIFNPPIDVTSKVEVAGGSGTGDVGYVIINDVTQSEVNFTTNGASNPPTYTTMYNGSGALSKLYIKDDVNPNNANECGFNGIKVDGVLLVNKGTNLYGDTKLIKETPYSDKLTVAGPTDLADMTGTAFMSDGTGSPGKYTQTPYKLVTTDFESVEDIPGPDTQRFSIETPNSVGDPVDVSTLTWTNGAAANQYSNARAYFDFGENTTAYVQKGSIYPALWTSDDGINWTQIENGAQDWLINPHKTTSRYVFMRSSGDGWGVETDFVQTLLTFPGAVSTNPDLQYFKAGDVVQSINNSTDEWSNYISVGSGPPAITPKAGFNGDPNSGADSQGENNYIQWSPPEIKNVINFKIRCRRANLTPGGINFTISGQGLQTTVIPSADIVNLISIPTTGAPITNVQVASDDPTKQSAGISQIYINGKELIDKSAGLGNDVSIISTDLVNNTMVVDGGQWDTSNRSEVWSTGASVTIGQADTGGVIPQNAFDGVLNNNYRTMHSNMEITLDFTSFPIAFQDKVEVYAATPSNNVSYNGTASVGVSHNNWSVVSPAGSGTLETLVLTNVDNKAAIAAVRVDGKVLADAVNDSQVWSNTTTFTNFDSSNSPNRLFDSDVATEVRSTSGNSLIIDFGQTFNDQQHKLEVYTYDRSVTVNGTTFTQGATQGYLDCGMQQFTSLEVGVASGTPTAWITAIRVDSKVLVDTGTELGLGDSNVEYQTNGGQGTIVDVNTGDNTLLIENTGDRDNRWIAENKANTDFAIAGPTIVDRPLLTTHVELESSQFATVPDGVDGLKEIIWNINNVDQSAGTLNPYRPTGLPLNSEVTIKVKHVANSIGESQWSTSTKFTTGASRTLQEHYVRQIRDLQMAIDAAQETIDDD